MNRNHVGTVTVLQDQDGENNIWKFFILDLSCTDVNVKNVCLFFNFLHILSHLLNSPRCLDTHLYAQLNCGIGVTSNISIILYPNFISFGERFCRKEL